jgi:hypothetical protein
LYTTFSALRQDLLRVRLIRPAFDLSSFQVREVMRER